MIMIHVIRGVLTGVLLVGVWVGIWWAVPLCLTVVVLNAEVLVLLKARGDLARAGENQQIWAAIQRMDYVIDHLARSFGRWRRPADLGPGPPRES